MAPMLIGLPRAFLPVPSPQTLFVGDAFPEPELRAILERAYARFRHPAVAPLRQLGPGDWLLELFHGPTLAFKDVAMQLIGGLFEASLRRSGRRITIVGATRQELVDGHPVELSQAIESGQRQRPFPAFVGSQHRRLELL